MLARVFGTTAGSSARDSDSDEVRGVAYVDRASGRLLRVSESVDVIPVGEASDDSEESPVSFPAAVGREDDALFESGARVVSGSMGTDFPLDRDAPRVTLLTPILPRSNPPLNREFFDSRLSCLQAAVTTRAGAFEDARGCLRADEVVALRARLSEWIGDGYWAREESVGGEFPALLDGNGSYVLGVWTAEDGTFYLGVDCALPRVTCEQIRVFISFGGSDARALASDQGVVQRAEARLLVYARSVLTDLARRLEVELDTDRELYRFYSVARIVDGQVVVLNRCASTRDGHHPILLFDSKKLGGYALRIGDASYQGDVHESARPATLPPAHPDGAKLARQAGADRTLFPVTVLHLD